MALTFTERFREKAGHKTHVIYEVAHDGSALTVDASDLGLNYIDYAMCRNKSGSTAYTDGLLSGNAYGPYIAIANALSDSADVDIIEAWGS